MSSTESTKSSKGTLIVSAAASAGFILIFALMLWFTYVPTYTNDVGHKIAEAREAKLLETNSVGKEILQKYAVVNKEKGIYRVPIEVAMEKTVKSYQ